MAEEEVVEEAPEAEESNDLRGMLESAFESAESPAPETVEVEETTSGRERDEKGRFAAKQSQETEPSETIEQPVAAPVPMPGGWDQGSQAEWNQLPRTVQETISRRQADLQRSYSQASEKAAQVEKTWSEVDQAIAPYKQRMAMNGISPAQLINQILSVQNYMDNDPVQGLRWMASTYGLDLKQLAEYESQQPQVAPEVREVQRQIQELKALQAQQMQYQQQQVQQGLESQIMAFANETDSNGNALRPHFQTLVDDIIPLVGHMKASNPGMNNRDLLQAAYEKAVWANPTTRQSELEKTKAEVVSKQISQKQAHVAQAKKAAKLINGAASEAYTPKIQPGNLRNMLEAAFDEST